MATRNEGNEKVASRLQSENLDSTSINVIEKDLDAIRRLTEEKTRINLEIGRHWHSLQRQALRHPQLTGALKSMYESAASW